MPRIAFRRFGCLYNDFKNLVTAVKHASQQFENAAVVADLAALQNRPRIASACSAGAFSTRECSSSRGSRLATPENRSSHSFPSFRLVPLNLHESLPGMR